MQAVNKGRTVAKRLHGNFNVVVFPGNIPSDFRFPDTKRATVVTYSVLAPEVIHQYETRVPIELVVSIMNGADALLYGWLEYGDIFTTTVRRRTEICVRIEIRGDPLSREFEQQDGPPVFNFPPYGPYNSIDGDCFYKPGQVPMMNEASQLQKEG
jgi:hypothetical protein